jgi:hypothetical protein
MDTQKQINGSVVVVESPDSVEYWKLPLTVNSLNKGYDRGTKLDWRSSLIRQEKSLHYEGFLREV